jgi:cyanate permease
MKPAMDKETEHRRILLRLAAKGNAHARRELEEEYHARLFSPTQLASYTPTVEQVILPAAIQRKFDSLFDVERDVAW